jgi:endonuclease G, mitochondrial
MSVPVSSITAVDQDLSTRTGFDPDFLGTHVALPAMSERLAADAATYERAGTPDHELRYEHFSLVMSTAHRFAIVTAVAIDGKRRLPIDRTNDNWDFDPRVPDAVQVGEELYKDNALDRGHLVRRLDPDWGDTLAESMRANFDTFHFTNCTPQHERFNQGKQLWAGLEDYVLNNAADHRMRVIVFTGPVFSTEDKEYRGVRIPRRYWKVVATVSTEGALHATAYMLSQQDLVGLAAPTGDDWVYGPYKTFQTSVGTVEGLTELDFGPLRAADPYRPEAGRFGARAEDRELGELTDMVL